MLYNPIMKFLLTFQILLLVTHVGITQEISYAYDKNDQLTLETIDKATFMPYFKAINQGTKNGIYWVKIKSNVNKKNIIQISNIHITDIKAYSDTKELQSIPSYRFISYEIFAQDYPVYLRINVKKEALIPISSFTHENFLKHEQLQMLIVGLFYGFALMVIIVNLFYFFNFHDRSFIYYALFLFSVGITFSHHDGFIQMLGVPKQFSYYSDIFMHTMTGFIGSFFAIEYLQLKHNFPKFIYSLYFVIAISFIFDLLFLYSNDFSFIVLSDIFIYYVFIGCWFVSLLLFKKYSYAVYFCLAYSLMVVLVFAFFIAPFFALASMTVDDNTLKIGAYFEMLIITYAVVVRMRTLQDENQKMHHDIIKFTQQLNTLSQDLNQSNKSEIDYMVKFDLSSRENEILELITQNKSNKEIAKLLFISVNTVKYHIKKLYQKLQIKNRKEVKTILKSS